MFIPWRFGGYGGAKRIEKLKKGHSILKYWTILIFFWTAFGLFIARNHAAFTLSFTMKDRE